MAALFVCLAETERHILIVLLEELFFGRQNRDANRIPILALPTRFPTNYPCAALRRRLGQFAQNLIPAGS
jgi:hypothetical protein